MSSGRWRCNFRIHGSAGNYVQLAVASNVNQDSTRFQVGCADYVAFPGRVLIPDQVALPVFGCDYNVIAAISIYVSHQAHVIFRAQRIEIDDLMSEYKWFLPGAHENILLLYITDSRLGRMVESIG